MDIEQVKRVRSFNRIVTRRVGALEDNYLSRGRPLGEARLIFEVGACDGSDVRILRKKLGLDAGYMSRLLRSLEKQDAIKLTRKAEDGRVRKVQLTDKGRTEFDAYDALSDDLAQSILAALSAPQRERLVASMGEVERLLRAASVEISVASSDSEDARCCLAQYFAELNQRFDNGFDPATGASAGAEASGQFVVARIDGDAIGCGALRQLEAGVGEVKRVWVSASARGQGVAGRIMQKLEAIARESGFHTLRLDTNKALTEAHALYRKLGYHEIARYNDNPYAHHWFEKVLDVEDPD